MKLNTVKLMKLLSDLTFMKSIIILLIITSSSIVNAQNDKAPEHKGIFIRGQLGIGTLSYRGIVFPFNVENNEDVIPAGYGNIDLGYSLSRNWALHLNLGQTGGQYKYFATTDDAIYRVTWLGIGASYYFIPSNIYISSSFMGSSLSYSDEALDVESLDAGGGFEFKLGKEWKVGKQFGIGVALIYTGIFWSDPENYREVVFEEFGGEIDDINASLFSVAFTATFN